MSNVFAKNFQKQSARAKEKLLESLGKADRTTDEQFEEHANNFAKQQKNAERVQKELRNYVTCIKSMGQASKAFHEALRETYETEWPGEEHVKAMSQSIELLWEDYHEKMVGQVLNPLNSYTNQFTDIKTKIGKRGRKLVDYDSARHSLDTSKATAKGPNDGKVAKAQEQMQLTKKLYDDINEELSDELPALYDSRITFFVNSYQTIFNLEHTFHGETAKLSRELCNQMDELGHALGRLRVQRKSSAKNSTPPPKSPSSPKTQNDVAKTPVNLTKASDSVAKLDSPGKRKDSKGEPTTPKELYPKIPEHKQNGESTVAPIASKEEEEESLNPFEGEGEEQKGSEEGPRPAIRSAGSEKKTEETSEKEPKEPNVLYKVRATHRYAAEDTDEISFEAGEVIKVTAFDDPEEQDEGWLNGVKESDGSKGVFPANFTKPL